MNNTGCMQYFYSSCGIRDIKKLSFKAFITEDLDIEELKIIIAGMLKVGLYIILSLITETKRKIEKAFCQTDMIDDYLDEQWKRTQDKPNEFGVLQCHRKGCLRYED